MTVSSSRFMYSGSLFQRGLGTPFCLQTVIEQDGIIKMMNDVNS